MQRPERAESQHPIWFVCAGGIATLKARAGMIISRIWRSVFYELTERVYG